MTATDTAEARIAAIEKLLEGHTDRNDEEMILSLLRDADDATLDATLQGLDLRRVLGDVDDRIIGPKHYSALLELLTRDRVAALSVPTREQLIAALQRGRTGSRDEAAIEALPVGGLPLTVRQLPGGIELAPYTSDGVVLVRPDGVIAQHRRDPGDACDIADFAPYLPSALG